MFEARIAGTRIPVSTATVGRGIENGGSKFSRLVLLSCFSEHLRGVYIIFIFVELEQKI